MEVREAQCWADLGLVYKSTTCPRRSTTPMDQYPRDVAQAIFAYKQSHPSLHKQSDPLPLTVRQLESLISACYQASLLREEGRSTRFVACVAEPEQFPILQKREDRATPLLLRTPIAFRAQELRRLAPALDRNRTVIGVRPVGPTDSTEMQVWGIVDGANLNWGGHLEDDYGELTLPRGFFASVLGPAHLHIGIGTADFYLRSGTLQFMDSPQLSAWPWVSDVFAAAIEMVGEYVASATRPLGDLATWKTVCKGQAALLLERLLRRVLKGIARQAHGGAIVVIPRDQTHAEHLRVKYGFNEPGDVRVHSAFLAKAKAMATWSSRFNLLSSAAREEAASSLVDRIDAEVGDTREDLFAASTGFVTQLAAVDGAVVLDDQLVVKGFGAELVDLPEVGRPISEIGLDGRQRDVAQEEFGTRHRSMFRFVSHHSRAIGLVLSQDGGGRVVVKEDGRVVSRQLELAH